MASDELSLSRTDLVKKLFVFDWTINFSGKDTLKSKNAHEVGIIVGKDLGAVLLHNKKFFGASLVMELVSPGNGTDDYIYEKKEDNVELELLEAKRKGILFKYGTGFKPSVADKLEKKNYVHDDGSYHIRLTVTHDATPASKHLERYKKTFTDELGSDFEIKVDGKSIKVSKAILMGQSEYFRTMIEANMSEKQGNFMQIVDFDYDVIYALVGYLYSETVEFCDVDFALHLLGASEKYGLQELKDKCEMYIVEHLNKENVWNVMSMTKLYKAKKATRAAVVFMAGCDEAEFEKLDE